MTVRDSIFNDRAAQVLQRPGARWPRRCRACSRRRSRCSCRRGRPTRGPTAESGRRRGDDARRSGSRAGPGRATAASCLTALDNLGVSHAESAQTLHTRWRRRPWAATSSPRWRSSPTWCFVPTSTTTRSSRSGPLLAEPAEPGGRPGHEGDLRAAAPALPRSLGPAVAGDDGGGRGADARRALRRFHQADLPAQRRDPGRRRRDRLAAAARRGRPVLRRLEAAARAERPRAARRAAPRPHLRETQQIQIALAYPAATVASPDYYRARAAAAILGGYSSARLFTEVREKRGLCYSVYASLRRPARPRGHALLRRHLGRPGAADARRDAGRDRPPRPRGRRRSTSWRPCARASRAR